MPTPSSYPQFQQVDAAGAIVGASSGPGGGSGSATSDALLADIKTQLVQVYSAIDGLELITGNIKIDAATMNLSVDGLEAGIAGLDTAAIAADLKLGLINAKLTDIRGFIDGIEGLLTSLSTSSGAIETQLSNIESVSGDTNTLLATQGADIGLMRTALAALKVSIETFQTQTGTDLGQLKITLDDLKILLTQVYGSTSNIDSSLATIELRTRPLIAVGTDVWDPGQGDYVASADIARRGVRINNNTGEANGRNAGTLFVAYNGDVPDRVTHVQFIKPGESAFLECPTLEFRVVCVGVSGVNGFYTIVRFE
jgi:hypothetical protein